MRKYYLLGRDRLVRELDAKPGDRIVEVGCGTARNLVRAARVYPEGSRSQSVGVTHLRFLTNYPRTTPISHAVRRALFVESASQRRYLTPLGVTSR